MGDLLRRLSGWLWPAPDTHALAALDGGPGPEPVPTDDEIRATIRERLVDGLDIPDAWMADFTPIPADPAALAELRDRFTSDVLVELNREYADRLPPGCEIAWVDELAPRPD